MSLPDYDYLASEATPIGMIGLRTHRLAAPSNALVTEVTLDHTVLMSSHATASERALAERAVARHGGRDLDVWVGGLGLGYTAHAALGCDAVARVEVVELLAPVIGWLEAGLGPLAESLRDDPRLRVRQGDAYAELAAAPSQRWDLVLVDVDHSPEERLADGSAGFYTAEGLRRAARHLKPGGVLGVWSYAESPAFAATLGEAFDDVAVEPVAFDNPTTGERETNPVYFARGPVG